MLIGSANRIAKFREKTNASPPVVLRRRRCKCGLSSTTKQLAQYGKCVACVKAAAA